MFGESDMANWCEFCVPFTVGTPKDKLTAKFDIKSGKVGTLESRIEVKFFAGRAMVRADAI